MKKLSKKDKRVLFWGGGSAVVILLLFYVVLPFFDSASLLEEELSQKRRALGQAVRIIEREDEYAEDVAALQEQLGEYRIQLLDATSTTMAQNQLENIVRSLAEQNGVTISRSTPLQQRKVGESYSKVTVQINLQTGMVELTEFLQALSTHPKYLEVDDFFMNVFRVRDRMRLQPRLNISGYIRLSEG